VTSFAILENGLTDETILVFGANQITKEEGVQIKEYILKVVGEVSGMEKPDGKSKTIVRRELLKVVFLWNRDRVEAYFKRLAVFVAGCLEHSDAEFPGKCTIRRDEDWVSRREG
jgi:hypothetical protein